MFIKNYIDELNVNMKVADIGAGHFRNLKLFQELGFENLYALDKDDTDNPLNVNLKQFIKHDIERGIPLNDKQFDLVLCNYVLMFIDPSKTNEVLDNLMRITRGFLIIETYPKKHKNYKITHYKEYNFTRIAKQIEDNPDFELLQVRKYYEKLTARRVK